MEICDVCKAGRYGCDRSYHCSGKCERFVFDMPRMQFVDSAFLDAMIDNWIEGANRPGRYVHSWAHLQWDDDMSQVYWDKLERHKSKALISGGSKVRRKHWAAVACNANILWHYES